MLVSGNARAELPFGEAKGFYVRFSLREAAVKAVLSFGGWKIGIDGKEGRLIIQGVDRVEKRLPETFSAGQEYSLAVEILDDGTAFMLNNRIRERSGNKRAQAGPMILEVEGSMGINLIEVRFMQ